MNKKPEVLLSNYTEWTDTVWLKHLGNEGFSQRNSDLFVICLGLGGELGEVAEEISNKNKDKILLELGDVAFYLARIVNFFNIKTEDIISDKIISSQTNDGNNHLKLCTSIGRTLDVVKKNIRDGKLDSNKLNSSISQSLVNLINLSSDYGYSFKDILVKNMEKNINRQNKNELRGSDTSCGKRLKP